MEQSLECSIEVGGDASGAARHGAAESLKFSAELWSIALNKSGDTLTMGDLSLDHCAFTVICIICKHINYEGMRVRERWKGYHKSSIREK